MKKLLFFCIIALFLIGCAEQKPPENGLVSDPNDFGKRDNVFGQEYFTEDEGVGLVDPATSEKSFDDFAEIEYLETLKDVDVSAIITDCEKHTDALEKDYCFQTKAADTADVQFCSKISDAVIKRQCIRGVALAKLDTSICRKIDLENGVYNCITLIASDEELVDESKCNEIPESNAWHQKCIDLVLAEKEKARQAALQ